MFNLPIHRERRDILHIDADAFFASVEQILNPKLKGKPVIVGGSKGHGIVCAASYEARKYGVHSAMPIYLAKKKCPQAICVDGHFEAYRDFSRRMYEILLKYTPEVEMASIDEAYLDITGCEKMHGCRSAEIAKKILMEIYKRLGLSVSCGLASSKTVAKTASSLNKPHKLTVVPFGKEIEFLSPLSLDRLPGIGPKTFYLLQRFGLNKIQDFIGLSSSEIVEKFGVGMIPLWKRAMGIDNSRVIANAAAPKSISKEHTFYKSDVNLKDALKVLKELSVIVLEKLRLNKLRAKTIFVKFRYKDLENKKAPFQDFSFQINLEKLSNTDSEIFPQMKELFLKNFQDELSLRLIGVGVSNLIENYNLSLFEKPNMEKLFSSIDKVRELYGDEKLRYGL